MSYHDLRHEAISRLFELGSLDMMEVAAISGHKSLSMLKRYTHLRAQKLVRKLEGHKSKGKQMVIDHLIPYPAAIEEKDKQVVVRLLDFDGVIGHGPDSDAAMRGAQDALLRKLLMLIRASEPIPAPDQYLDNIPDNLLVMVDPMCLEMA